jgi:hypothetical protein
LIASAVDQRTQKLFEVFAGMLSGLLALYFVHNS